MYHMIQKLTETSANQGWVNSLPETFTPAEVIQKRQIKTPSGFSQSLQKTGAMDSWVNSLKSETSAK